MCLCLCWCSVLRCCSHQETYHHTIHARRAGSFYSSGPQRGIERCCPAILLNLHIHATAVGSLYSLQAGPVEAWRG